MKTIVELYTGTVKVTDGVQVLNTEKKTLVGFHSKYAIKKRYGRNAKGFRIEDAQGKEVKAFTLINASGGGVVVDTIHRD